MKKVFTLAAISALAASAVAAPPFLDRDPEAIDALSANTPRGADGVPDFLIVGKPGKFYLGVGGQIKVTASMDMGHPIPSANEFITSDIPMGDMQGNGAAFKFSAQQSSLYLNMVAFPDSKNKVGAYIGFNLMGENYCPSLVYAYLRWRGFQAGYDYNLFSDPDAIPPSVDYEGPNAITATGTAGIRYHVDFGRHRDWRFQIGAELPFQSYTDASLRGATYAEAVSQRVPDIPVAIQYGWRVNGGGHVRLAGVLRNLYSRNVAASKNVDHLGWGVQLSATGNILPNLTAYAMGVYGKGIAGYFQDLRGDGLDLTPKGDGRNLTTSPAWGAYGALTWQIAPRVSLTGSYSHIRLYIDSYEGGATPWGEQYRYGQYASGTLLWTPARNLQAGLEYIWGRRVNCDGAKAADNRIQASLSFSF